MQEIKVWDWFIRFFHWAVVGLVLLNFTLFEEGAVHETLGYAVMGLVALRLVWGLIGPRFARFVNFFPTPARVRRHISHIRAGKPEISPGHNPLGALMIFNLILTLILVGVTGYLATTDRFWGVEWVEETHEFLANYLLFSVLLHVGGVLWESARSGVNLISAMITGIKKIPVAEGNADDRL